MIENMKQWLEALESADWYIDLLEMIVYSAEDNDTHEERIKIQQAITSLRQAIAELESQEPVAWMFEDDEDNGHKTFRQTPPSPEVVAYLAKWNRPAWVPIYTHPPQRKPLTDEQIDQLVVSELGLDADADTMHDFARAIEAAHGIKE